MLDLNGIISVETIKELSEYTSLRLRNSDHYVCAEALGMYEQNLAPSDLILNLCEKAMGKKLLMPVPSYLPNNIIRHFSSSDVVPISFKPSSNTVTCLALSELGTNFMPLPNYNVDVVETTIYYYFQQYVKLYGNHRDLAIVPARQLLNSIINEAVALDAADITISSVRNSASVYYNVRKKKVYSQRILSSEDMEDIIKCLCIESPMDTMSNKPKYVGVSLNDDYRGRVCINKKFKGYEITIRLLPNEAFNKTLDDLNLNPPTIDFVRTYFMNNEKGLRLIVGATMSGKNTTALALLNELVQSDTKKVVSIEMPVEQELENVEQINCEDEEEYQLNISSLLRQNPDMVYITEIGDTTAVPVLKMTNTGKWVLSTLHANGCADVILRLMDITNLPPERIIPNIQSIIYQELIRDEENDRVYPRDRYVYLSQERKNKLYGMPLGEIITSIQSWEGGDLWT